MLIYKITNYINEKCYIGITSKDLKTRFGWHLRDARLGKPKKLYDAMREIGFEKFEIELLDECDDDNITIRKLEEFYIEKFNSFRNGYNASPKSGGVKNHNAESRAKMSKARKGKTYEELLGIEKAAETKQKLSNVLLGRKVTDEFRLKMSKINKGRIKTEEEKRRHSEFMAGRKHSDETKMKMSQSRKGKLLSKIGHTVCPHCNKSGSGNAMFRWHFDNCKGK